MLCIARYHGMTDSATGDQEIADKWEAQLRKGCLELAILAALSDAKLYGLEILERVESDSVESEAGHPRKYHSLTAAGRRRLREMARTWKRFSASMGRLLAPLGKG